MRTSRSISFSSVRNATREPHAFYRTFLFFQSLHSVKRHAREYTTDIYIYIRVRRSSISKCSRRRERRERCGEKTIYFTSTTESRRSTHFEFRRGRFPDRPGEGTWFDRSIQDGWILWSGPTATKFVSRLERFWRATPSGVKRALFGYFQPRAESPRTPLLTRSPRSKRTVLLPTECSSFR